LQAAEKNDSGYRFWVAISGWQFRGGNFGVAISGWPFWVAQRFSAAITDLVLNGGFSR
jgi:hypothetical protein